MMSKGHKTNPILLEPCLGNFLLPVLMVASGAATQLYTC